MSGLKLLQFVFLDKGLRRKSKKVRTKRPVEPVDEQRPFSCEPAMTKDYSVSPR